MIPLEFPANYFISLIHILVPGHSHSPKLECSKHADNTNKAVLLLFLLLCFVRKYVMKSVSQYKSDTRVVLVSIYNSGSIMQLVKNLLLNVNFRNEHKQTFACVWERIWHRKWCTCCTEITLWEKKQQASYSQTDRFINTMFERTGKQQQTNRMNQCNNKMFDDKMYKMITSANTHTIQMKFGLKMLSNNYQRIDACTSNFVEKIQMNREEKCVHIRRRLWFSQKIRSLSLKTSREQLQQKPKQIR